MSSSAQTSFIEVAKSKQRLTISTEILADFETPLSAYWKLAHDEKFSFLLESVTGGEQVSRYSVLGVRPRKIIRTKNGQVWEGEGETTTRFKLKPGQDPLHYLADQLGTPEPFTAVGLPAFAGGAVGLMAYDIVRYFENLPDSCEDDLQIDDLAMMITEAVVVFDHAKNLIRVVAQGENDTEGRRRAEEEITRIVQRLAGPLPQLPRGKYLKHPVTSNMTQERFEANVTKMVDLITQGDGVQFVPSQRFATKVDAHPITVYRALRSINPSPYMFLLRFEEFDLVGSSPELLVSLHDQTAHLRPIAGTRWRGIDAEEDNRLAEQLLADEKERAEHVMLVDLGRNDLGRVCKYGSVKVNELMVIEKYSHVMHIVSDVTGTIEAGKDAFDLVRACHPAGTVSGAPKVRAMQIIDELEPNRRGVYAGSVGFFSTTGNMDTCIAIRTILIKNGTAYVQAGGGVVFDSTPTNEYVESCNKAKACLRAIEVAQNDLSEG